MKKQEISFQKTEPVPADLVRISNQLIEDAVKRIMEPGADRAEDLHNVRLAIKRLRAMLRLVQPAIGKGLFRRENAALRNTAHKLAFSRDVTIAQHTLAALSKSVSSKSDRNAVTVVLSRFETGAPSRPKVEQVLKSVARDLKQEGTRIGGLEFAADQWETMGPGLKKVYAQCRRRMHAAYAGGSDDAFHKWRIRVKNLYYQLQFLEPIGPKKLGKMISRLKKLQDKIGSDHDLVVVKSLLLKSPEKFGGAEVVERVVACLEQKSRKLRRASKPCGEPFFKEKPRCFAGNLAKHWRNWRKET